MSSEEKKVAETPLMKQYNEIKAKYPGALLLFRVGDFYETFGEDAITTSRILGIVLTRRANGAAQYVELAGFPHHSLDSYLPRLVKAGQRVAICDQLEDPKLTKKIVKRGVTELVTPGVAYNDKILEHNANNFLASVHLNGTQTGIAFLDVSTGEFLAAQGDLYHIEKLLQSFKPSEVIVQKNKLQKFTEAFGDKYYTTTYDDWLFTKDYTYSLLLKQFNTTSLKGFGVEELDSAIIAAGATLYYLSDTQHDKTAHICKLARIEEDKFVWLDKFTIRNLEILYSLHENGMSLFDVLDETSSPMGARMLRQWIMMPLKDISRITQRYEVVAFFMASQQITEETRKHIKSMGDLERLISKAAVGKIMPRELLQVKRALDAIVPIKEMCLTENNPLCTIGEQLNTCSLIAERIGKEIMPEAPALVNKGNVIAAGVNAELDHLRSIAHSGKDYLAQLQQKEIERTGITSLKVSYNNVFGYYLEVTHSHKSKVPDDWERKQTLVNAERYITPELKEYEEKIVGAEEKIQVLELQLYNELVLAVADYIQPIQLNAQLIARIDCLISFAIIAEKNKYVQPVLNDSFSLDIKNGRHPVIEQRLPVGQEYIPNDVFLDNDQQQIIMVTGPNMSGKSALLRQTALIVLMAQMGSYVPAETATLGITDKIFTRVGASDNISSGESTFMVEMNETASIMNNISNRSLILLDEIGRGTSTFDGISIAWAIAEYIHDHPLFRARTLFATHYHELNEMARTHARIKNFHVTVKEVNNKIIFLRKLTKGGTEHSFGIHVARMAGMPARIIERANQVLVQLEKSHDSLELTNTTKQQDPNYQLSFIQLDDPLLEQIKDDILNTDINTLTPVEALMKLNEIKKLLGRKG